MNGRLNKMMREESGTVKQT